MTGASACTCAQAQRAEHSEAAADTSAIIVAGGSGERFGDPRGKQFVELAGLPLVAWSILAFDAAPSVRELVVVCASERAHQMTQNVLGRIEVRNEVVLAPAGSTRQASVFSGLMAASDEAAFVAIHDGARPLVEVETIERCIAAVREDREVAGALCASRETDTLKVVDENGRVLATPDRTRIWCAQTPQVFRRATVLAAHEQALMQGFAGTDDASLVEHAGQGVRVVESPRDNIKVTVAEDLSLAEAILRRRMGIE